MERCGNWPCEDDASCCGGDGWVAPDYENSPPLEIVLDAALYAEVAKEERKG